LEWGSVTEWQAADDRNNREKINRARQAAEDLFKPSRHVAEAGLPAASPDQAVPAEQPGRRQPRIFNLPPRMSPVIQADTPPEPKPLRRKPVAKSPASVVPASHIGRIRTLARYGMTPAQVAELYDVTVAEVERIIRAPADPGKSR
jgi:hypothetical protein